MEVYIGLLILFISNIAGLIVFIIALWRASRHIHFDVFQLTTMFLYVVLLLCMITETVISYNMDITFSSWRI